MENDTVISDRTVNTESTNANRFEQNIPYFIPPDERINRARPENPFYEVEIE